MPSPLAALPPSHCGTMDWTMDQGVLGINHQAVCLNKIGYSLSVRTCAPSEANEKMTNISDAVSVQNVKLGTAHTDGVMIELASAGCLNGTHAVPCDQMSSEQRYIS